MILMVKKLLEVFMKKNCKRLIKEFRIVDTSSFALKANLAN